MRLRYLMLSFSVFLLIACAEQGDGTPASVAAPATERALPHGDVIGSANDAGAHQWLGIPFAKAPVGKLRWRAPQALAPWTETLQALTHGSACTQPAGLLAPPDEAIDGVYGSEDCLYLNVYAPTMTTAMAADATLPVMLWIHGGGNSVGRASTYDASQLAVSQNVIVVTIHYRLGPLGWFYHSGLHAGAADDQDRSGNYGTLDIIAALQWTQNNIAGFGGDPRRVTVFGESAGGVNVFSMLLSPLAKGLFQRAISQSGLAVTGSIDDATTDEKNSSHGIADKLIEEHHSTSIDQLRELPAADIVRAYIDGPDTMMLEMPTVFADGTVLPTEDPLTLFRSGRFNKVPTMLGTNRDEQKLFMSMDPRYVTRWLGFWMKRKDAARYDRDAYYGSQRWRAMGADEPARAMGMPVYNYRFDWDGLGKPLWMDMPGIFGAAHAFELPFVFGELDLGPLTQMINSGKDAQGREKLSTAMMDYWGNFAHHGNPNKGKPVSVSWPAWHEVEQFLIFDDKAGGGVRSSEESVSIAGLMTDLGSDERFASAEERCEFFRELVLWSKQLASYTKQLGCQL